MSNPIHPRCTTTRASWKHSKTKSGSQRYKCPDCLEVFNPFPQNKQIGERPLSAAEKQKRYRRKKMTVFYTIYSPENKGYWVGGLGSDAEYSLRVEGAQPVIGLEDDVTKLLDDVDTDPSSKIYWEKHETPDLPGSESMQAYLV